MPFVFVKLAVVARKPHLALAFFLVVLGLTLVACQRTEEAEGPAVEADQGPEPGARRRQAHALSEGGPDLETPLPTERSSPGGAIEDDVGPVGGDSRGLAEESTTDDTDEEDAADEDVEVLTEP